MSQVSALCFFLTSAALAQPISLGFKAGVPITDAFQTVQGNSGSYFTNTKRYLIGPTVQVNLPGRFAIEVDALYKRIGYQCEQASPSAVYAKTVANSWEFPLLVKWAILPGPVRPFVDTGAAWRHISGIQQFRSVANAAGVELNNASEFNKRNDIGFVFGGGVEFAVGRLRISPELRYTRWGSESFRDPVNALLRTNRNQGDFILGFRF
ncbi:MAG: PorT family protein [Bryobacteraceae bacterium]|nr:PorT family protein [Bryobacteraceae bacterium]